MHRLSSAAIAGLTALALAGAGALAAPTAGAAPTQSDSAPSSVAAQPGLLDGGDPGSRTIDRRQGEASPTDAQRASRRQSGVSVRWNEYGTPATVTADGAVSALQAGPGRAGAPEEVARSYLRSSNALFGLDAAAIGRLETLALVEMGEGAIVTMRQRVGGLPTTQGGLVTVAVRDGAVLHVSSSLTRSASTRVAATLDAATARERATDAAELDPAATEVLRTRRVAVPTPQAGTRTAYEVVLAETGGEGAAYTVLIDAANGELLVRENIVNHLEDNPTWTLFGSTPPDEQSTQREMWCWLPTAGCADDVDSGASPLPWDVDPASETSTQTTEGNNALAGEAWDLQPFLPMISRTAEPREDRDYDYTFDNVWRESGCDPEVLNSDDGNDIDAATASLFAHHNRVHDFAYHLGFTEQTWNAQQSNFGRGGREGDPEIGKAQSGAKLGIRDNANQYTPPDGIAPWSNMYLWQPIAGAAYPPCVDGDFDGTVIGHEYTHMITNRMVAGPDAGLSGYQAGGMGESWSDLLAMEYLYELGKRPKGDSPYVTGAYVTGDDRQGIRNYDMSHSPLNYSDIGYDVVGQSVHSEGEIWSATNFTVRAAMIEHHGDGDAELQRSCAEGATPVDECPGNRKWAQLVFDSLLVPATGQVSMVDMRDAMLVADQLRFGGANQDVLWNAFAQRGLGQHATSQGPNDTDPVADFSSPYSNDANVRFRVIGRTNEPVQFYVGAYEKEAQPVADSDPSTERDAWATLTPGTYEGLAVGPSIGHHRFEFEVKPGQRRTIPVRASNNLAASANGATASGDGADAGALLDGTEATAWSAQAEDVEGQGVTVDLAGDRRQQVSRVNVSAFFESAGRFGALRQFAVLACDATTGADCEEPGAFDQVYVSPADAFPGDGFRPTAPDLLLRSFAIPRTTATHLRLEVVSNQCTGGPEFQGDLDNDPDNVTDCPSGAPETAQTVEAAEFQAFTR